MSRTPAEKAEMPSDGKPFVICQVCLHGIHFLNIRKAQAEGTPSHDCRRGRL